MKILALDSSGNVASIALLEDDVLKAEYTIDYKKTHSQTLLPMLDELKRMTELDLESIDAIAIAAGPGSFTGLRIGAATAKGLALALEKPIVPVPTTEGLAYNLYGHNGVICPIMDARREQVYTGLYGFISASEECDTCDSKEDHYEFVCIKETSAMGIEELCGILNERGEEVIFRENIDAPTNTYRIEMEGDRKNYDYEREDMGKLGFQKQEFDEKGELTDIEDDFSEDEDDFDGDFSDMDSDESEE